MRIISSGSHGYQWKIKLVYPNSMCGDLKEVSFLSHVHLTNWMRMSSELMSLKIPLKKQPDCNWTQRSRKGNMSFCGFPKYTWDAPWKLETDAAPCWIILHYAISSSMSTTIPTRRILPNLVYTRESWDWKVKKTSPAILSCYFWRIFNDVSSQYITDIVLFLLELSPHNHRLDNSLGKDFNT